MHLTRIAFLVLACEIVNAISKTEPYPTITPINTTLSVLTIDNNVRFIEERITFHIQENDFNVINKPIVQTQIVQSYQVDDRFRDYQLSKIVQDDKQGLFVVGKTPQNKYFIGRPALGNNGKIVYNLVIERWYPILDMASVLLPDNESNHTHVNDCSRYLYWLEKQDHITVYSALYRVSGHCHDTGDDNPHVNRTIENIQKYHTFSRYIQDATILSHQESRNIFIAIATPTDVMLVKFQKSTVPLPLMQHSSKCYLSACRFLSKLNYFGVRHVITLLQCEVNNDNETDTLPAKENDYLIVNTFNGDTVTRRSNHTPYSTYITPQSDDDTAFMHQYSAVLYHLTEQHQLNPVSLLFAFNVAPGINVFLYNNDIGWLFASGPNEMIKSHFSLHVGQIRLITSHRYPLLSYNTSCQPILPRHPKNLVIPKWPDNKIKDAQQIVISDNNINLNCSLITKGGNNTMGQDQVQALWMPVILGVLSVLVFIVIIILLFIIRKNVIFQ